jgi:tetratricopeptide (TPR) repeat protein
LLRSKAPEILRTVFNPTRLVQPSLSIAASYELLTHFESAVGLFRRGMFPEAYTMFLEVERRGESLRRGAGRTARLNAAACAIAEGKNGAVLELLQPIRSTGKLYAGPLWNLGLALYRLGNPGEALKVVEDWITRAPESLRATGLLVAAALSSLTGDDTSAAAKLNDATALNKNFVSKKLGLRLDASGISAPASSNSSSSRLILAPERQNQLHTLLSPKRPGRSPLLSAFLTREEIEGFARAIEAIAESDQDQARDELIRLRDKHPGAALLDMAVASCELYAGDYLKAHEILTRVEESGVKLPGSALWNLACAQVRMGDFDSALRSLKACAETEFRTKRELWTAIQLLGGGTRTGPPPSPAPGGTHKLLEQLPISVEECRLELLRRLVVPGKPARGFRPDFGRLPARDRRIAGRVLDAAHRAAPPEGLSMLLPLIRQYPDIYTLRFHAAAFALLSGDISQASAQLKQAALIRPLDAISIRNLAFTYLTSGDISGLLSAMDAGIHTSLADHPLFWLTLSIARTQLGKTSAAADAAARASSIASGENSKIVRSALSACNIKAASAVAGQDPSVAAAREALLRLRRGDIQGAVASISAIAGPNVAPVPEIGLRVLEPQFVPRPSREWSKDNVKLFNAAVRSFREGHYGQSATEFNTLYRSIQKPGIAVNMTAAYLKAGEPIRARTIASKALREHKLGMADRLQLCLSLFSGKRHQTCSSYTPAASRKNTDSSACSAMFLRNQRQLSPRNDGHCIGAVARFSCAAKQRTNAGSCLDEADNGQPGCARCASGAQRRIQNT